MGWRGVVARRVDGEERACGRLQGKGEMRRVDASYHGVGDEKLGKWIRKKESLSTLHNGS